MDWANKWYKQKTNQPWYRGATIEEQISFSKDYSVGANKNVARELTSQNADKFAATFKDMTKHQLQQVINTLTKGKRTGKTVRVSAITHTAKAISCPCLQRHRESQQQEPGRRPPTINQIGRSSRRKHSQARPDGRQPEGKQGVNQQVSLVKEAQDHIASRTVSTHQSRTTAAHKQQTEAEKAAKEQAKANEKTAEETYKYSQQQEQQQKANQLLQAQAIVDAMQEGEAKKLASSTSTTRRERSHRQGGTIAPPGKDRPCEEPMGCRSKA